MAADNYKRWICEACGLIYDEAKGDPDSGLAPGTRFDDIPDDWKCPLCGMTKSDLRLMPDTPPAQQRAAQPVARRNQSSGGHDYVVIVGGGVAGWAAAEAIRRGNTDQPVLLVTACAGLVYPKPAISIAMSQGRSADDLVDKDGETYAAELGIEIRTATRVIKIDRDRKRLVTAKGAIEYGQLVMALGANQRHLPVAGDAADAVMTVNDLSSYRRYRELLQHGNAHVTILGAGLIGCEFANDLVKSGFRVSVVDPSSRPLASLLPEPMGMDLQQRLAGEGVDWRLGATVSRIDRVDGRLQASLSNNETIDTDLVLSAAGLVPNIALARKSGLAVDGGIAVNEDMQTSDADIYALGDCAAVDGRVYAFIEPIRRQAATIAENIAGRKQPFAMTPPLVRVKTSSMPISVSSRQVPGSLDWKAVNSEVGGLYFEARENGELVGFALSDRLADNAGNLHRQVME